MVAVLELGKRSSGSLCPALPLRPLLYKTLSVCGQRTRGTHRSLGALPQSLFPLALAALNFCLELCSSLSETNPAQGGSHCEGLQSLSLGSAPWGAELCSHQWSVHACISY